MKTTDLENLDLVSNLTTINIIKLQDYVWKVVENGKYSGERTDIEIFEIVERLASKGFEIIIAPNRC